MGRHTFSVSGDQYLLDFHDDQVYITLDRWREVRGDVWAQVTVRTSAPGVLPHLHSSRWNLCSMSQRAALIRTLRARFSEPDWAEIIERTALVALERYRAGEPVVMVGRLDRSPAPQYLIEPILPANQLVMIYGLGGSGKSYLALALCLMVQEGFPLQGATLVAPPGPALYLDWETSPEEQDARLKMLANGAGYAEIPEIRYRRCAGALADQIDDIRRLAVGASLIVVDSVGLACGDEPETAGAFLRLASACRTLNTTVLLIDHPPKDSDEPFGSAYKTYACRTVWRLKRQQEEGEDRINMGLWCTKTNLTKKHRPLGWRLEFDNAAETATFHRQDVRDVEAFRAELSAREQIRTYLLSVGAATAKGIADETGLPYNTVRETLKRMEGKAQVSRLPREGEREVYWGVPHEHRGG